MGGGIKVPIKVEEEVKMKFKIQEFGKGTPPKRETEVYFSLRINEDDRLVLRASNERGDPGREILVIRENGRMYRPAPFVKIGVKGLSFNDAGQINIAG